MRNTNPMHYATLDAAQTLARADASLAQYAADDAARAATLAATLASIEAAVESTLAAQRRAHFLATA